MAAFKSLGLMLGILCVQNTDALAHGQRPQWIHNDNAFCNSHDCTQFRGQGRGHPQPGTSPTKHQPGFDRSQRVFNYTWNHGYHIAPWHQSPPTSGVSHTEDWVYIGTTDASTATKPAPTNTTATSSMTNATHLSQPCAPELRLCGASETGFNALGSPFTLEVVSCFSFDIQNTTVLANFKPLEGINVTTDKIAFPGLTDEYVLLSVFALGLDGFPLIESYQLLFGAVNMPILVLDDDGQPASDVLVYGNATAYPGVGMECSTNPEGVCYLSNLPATSISLVATAQNNSIAVDGLATTSTQVTLRLMPFVVPASDSTIIGNGTTGWRMGNASAVGLSRRDTSLVVSTNGQYTLQTASNSFRVHPFTKTAYIKYKFVTEEVPGGYFGTKYNDYYSVTIRSDTGGLVTVTNNMNALGLGAFDSSGATDWFTLTLNVAENTKYIDFIIGVSNVEDNILDSSIVVAQVGDLQCDKCGDCDSCPSDPMCQNTCTNPARGSCDFYSNCAERQLGCGPGGYPLAYGAKNCNRFVKNLNYFSAVQGHNWIFDTMLCLQKAMVPVLKPCTASCASFSQAAFNSHPKCYVDSGFCGLQCPDILATMITVNTDLVSLESVKQVAATAGGCVANLLQTLSGCTGDIAFAAGVAALPGGGVAAKTLLLVTQSFFRYASSAL